MANVKITALTNIGSNILYSALIPMVNMTGTPVTQQGNIQILGNYILSGAGTANFAPAYLSNLAYSVVNAAQPNITSVGTLTSLAVTGNVTSNNYMTANFFVGDGGLLTNLSIAGTSISNGTSNVSIPAAGGNILFARGGTSNVVVITGTGANIAGTLNATGNANTGNIGATNGVFTTVSGNISATNLNVSGNVTSNLLPNANVTYNLGSSTQRWNDIWLSNSTIYIGDSSISAGSGNSIIFSGPVQADGNITSNAGSNVTVITETGNTTHAWSFGADGNLTLPNNSFAINYANGSQVQLSGANIGNFAFTSNTISLDGITTSNLYIQNDNTAKARIIIPSSTDANVVELTLQNFGDSGVHVLTGNAGIEEHMWHFDSTGNFNMPGNTIMEGYQLFVGPGAQALPNVADATLAISSNSAAFIQAIINNVSDIGSADWVAQGHYGDDNGGYSDLGFNSSAHTDPEYDITGPGDGYFFVEGYYPGQAPGSSGGNLVLATGENGDYKDIVFATGGFTSANMFAKFSDANNAFEITRSGATILFPDNSEIGERGAPSIFGIYGTANVNISANTANWQFGINSTLSFPAVALASLPAAATIGAGARAFITDANLVASGNFGAAVSGSGSNNVPVYSDGSNWRIG